MKVRLLDTDPLDHSTPLLAVGVPKGADASSGLLADLDRAAGGALTRAMSGGDFSGRIGEEATFWVSGSGPGRVCLLGLGDPAILDAEGVRGMAGRAVRLAERLRTDGLSIRVPDGVKNGNAVAVQAAAEAAVLAAWSFRELKTNSDADSVPARVGAVDLLVDGADAALKTAARTGEVIGNAENFARMLQSRPGNVATPTHLADEARTMADDVGLDITVFDEAELEKRGMHAILAVSQGSAEEARLIILEHRGAGDDSKPLVLVGKGLTFDAGGISIKPAKGMESMKFDMSGGAAVLGAMKALAELEVPLNVIGIVPSSENLPSSTALKPGDVIRTLAGKTVEVINTDAEGRLILADALAYGAGREPAAMVDCATLTGAVVVGLGHHAAGLLGNDEDLLDELEEAGVRSGERCWPLPLWDEYRRQLDSDTADLANVGGRPGGTITAAAFLREFVGDVPWAHLDIAGTAYGDAPRPYQRKGAYGSPTRLLVEWVRSRSD